MTDSFETPNRTRNNIPKVVCTDQKLFNFPRIWPEVSRYYHRLVDRDGNFHQSKGKLRIKKLIEKTEWNALYSLDWFHSLIDAPTSRSVLLILMCYMTLLFIFALLYYLLAVNYEDCNLGVKNFLEAFMFSLQTMATIGFGANEGDIFFGDCYYFAIILAVQICTKIISDAVIIGVIYSRISRPNKRATTILFSNNAVIRRIRDKYYFMFQLCELRKHQLTEAHVSSRI